MGTKEQMVKIHRKAMENQKKALIDKACEWLERGGLIVKMWIARDECGSLWLHRKRPKLETNGCWISDDFWQLEERDYPEVTFENSPMEVELVLKK